LEAPVGLHAFLSQRASLFDLYWPTRAYRIFLLATKPAKLLSAEINPSIRHSIGSGVVFVAGIPAAASTLNGPLRTMSCLLDQLQ
jgi:hypothetical protein